MTRLIAFLDSLGCKIGWTQLDRDVALAVIGAVLGVVLGFSLAVIWDMYKSHTAWKGHKQTLVAELEANAAVLNSRLHNLPEAVSQAVSAVWKGTAIGLNTDVLRQLPTLSLSVPLNTNAWESITALGLVPRLRHARVAVSRAYAVTVSANHNSALCLPLYELSLNPGIPLSERDSFRQASQLSAIFALSNCLPAIQLALNGLK